MRSMLNATVAHLQSLYTAVTLTKQARTVISRFVNLGRGAPLFGILGPRFYAIARAKNTEPTVPKKRRYDEPTEPTLDGSIAR